MRGGGFLDFLGKANDFLKSSKLGSTIANGLGAAGIPYASSVGSALGSFGYGRKRVGRGLRLAGSGLGLAGRRRRHR